MFPSAESGASALAKFYCMLANGGKLNGQTFFSQETLAPAPAFADVMNQMEQSVLPNEKSLRLVDAIYS